MSLSAAAEHARPPSRATRGANVVIRPSSGWRALDLPELWRFRELLYFLIWRDLKVRYKQTALGVIWVVLQPLLGMAVFSLFFGVFAKLPSDGLPYPIFAYTGVVIWTYFASAVGNASASLVTNANLVSKVYFPRLLLPLASVLAALVDLAIGMVVLVPLLLAFGVAPSPRMLLAAPLIGLTVLAALGVGLWLAAIDVRYRDVRHAVPFLMQVWLFATPVVYPASLVPEPWRALYGLNPLAGVVSAARWALLGHGGPSAGMLALSAGIVLLLVVSGLFYFRRSERAFADVI